MIHKFIAIQRGVSTEEHEYYPDGVFPPVITAVPYSMAYVSVVANVTMYMSHIGIGIGVATGIGAGVATGVATGVGTVGPAAPRPVRPGPRWGDPEAQPSANVGM